jgi:hypothetical protein
VEPVQHVVGVSKRALTRWDNEIIGARGSSHELLPAGELPLGEQGRVDRMDRHVAGHLGLDVLFLLGLRGVARFDLQAPKRPKLGIVVAPAPGCCLAEASATGEEACGVEHSAVPGSPVVNDNLLDLAPRENRRATPRRILVAALGQRSTLELAGVRAKHLAVDGVLEHRAECSPDVSHRACAKLFLLGADLRLELREQRLRMATTNGIEGHVGKLRVRLENVDPNAAFIILGRGQPLGPAARRPVGEPDPHGERPGLLSDDLRLGSELLLDLLRVLESEVLVDAELLRSALAALPADRRIHVADVELAVLEVGGRHGLAPDGNASGHVVIHRR